MTTKKKPELECVCGKNRSPVYAKSGEIVGHFCKNCGCFVPKDTKLAPVLWEELSEDAMDNARNLLDVHEDKTYDMMIREIPS